MDILIAPDKFKGSLTAADVAAHLAKGIRLASPAATFDLCPVADGGEGIVAALVAATGGRLVHHRVTGPLPDMKVDAAFGILGDGQTAVIEMAAASGLALLKPEDRNPLNTTTFGTGELMVAAAKLGVKTIILGIGGSATTDAGIGCCQAIGLPVLLADGEPVSPTEPLVGRDMERVVLVKHGRGSPVEGIRVIVACDVSNPLFGPSGAAPVFGPQKGATSHMVRWLDQQLHGLAERTGTLAVAQTHGAGAAGGLGFGLLAWLPGTSLRPGVDLVFDALQVPRRIVQAKLVITGEGRLDASSLHGKAPVAVARACAEVGVPCIAVVGSFDQAIAADVRPLFQRVFALRTGDMTLEQATREAPHRLAEFGRLIAKSLLPT